MEPVKICHFKTLRAGNFAFRTFCCFFLHYIHVKEFVCEDISAEYEFESEKFKGSTHRLKIKQDACTGIHSACRREEMCTTPSTAQAGADAGTSWSYGGGGGAGGGS